LWQKESFGVGRDRFCECGPDQRHKQVVDASDKGRLWTSAESDRRVEIALSPVIEVAASRFVTPIEIGRFSAAMPESGRGRSQGINAKSLTAAEREQPIQGSRKVEHLSSGRMPQGNTRLTPTSTVTSAGSRKNARPIKA